MSLWQASLLQWDNWTNQTVQERHDSLRHLLGEIPAAYPHIVVLPRFTLHVLAGHPFNHGHPDPLLTSQEMACLFQFSSELARSAGLFLVAGSGQTLASDGEPREVSPVFAPGGALLGMIERIHVRSAAGRLAGGRAIQAIDCDSFTIGILLAEDVQSPEQCRILALMGCDVFISLQAGSEFSQVRQSAGIWQQVQQNQVFGLESHLSGMGFAGPQAVFGPCDMEPGHSGHMASLSIPGNRWLNMILDPTLLAHARDQFTVFRQFNTTLYEKMFRAGARGVSLGKAD